MSKNDLITITVSRNMLSQLVDSARARAEQFDFDPFNPEAFSPHHRSVHSLPRCILTIAPD